MLNERKWLDDIEASVEKEKKNYKGPHCCLTMEASLARSKYLLEYDEKMREYSVYCKPHGGFIMDHCPFCGSRLPSSLRDKWFDELENILNIEVPIDIDKRKMPKDFKTDAWWKKRGL